MPKKTTQKSGQTKKGFAAMPKEKQRELAKKGGERSHSGGRHSTQSGK